MADISKTIEVIFQGTDNLGKTITGIGANLDQLSGKVASATQPLADLAASAVKLEAALGALALGGLVLAFNAASNFEAASIELQKVIGDEIALLTKAELSAKSLSSQYGQSASEILGSTADFKQAGFTVSQAMTLTRDAMDLVIAGNIEAGDASNYLISIIKGFKAPFTDARVALDLINSVSNNFATNVEQLAIGMADLSPVAKQAGLTMNETAGLLTPIIEVFRNGSEAAAALKIGLLNLITDNPRVVEALEALKVSQKDANGQLRLAGDILFDVQEAFTNLSKEEKLYYTQQLVGKNQTARMVEVFDGLAKTQEVVAVGFKSTGSAAEEVAVRLKSAEVAVDRIKTSFVNLGIEIGVKFIESAKGALDGTTEINQAMWRLASGPTFDPVFEEIRRFGEKLSTDFKGIAAALPAAFELVEWDPLIDSVKDLGNEVVGLFDAFFGDIDLTTPEGLAAAIQKILDTGESLTRVVGGILDAWQPFISALSAGIDKINDSDDAVKELVGQFGGWAGVINTVAKNTGLLTGALAFLGTALSLNIVTTLGKSIVQLGLFAAKIPGLTLGLGALTKAAVAFGLGWTIGKVLRDNIPIVREMGDALGELLFNVVHFGDDSVVAAEKQAKMTTALGDQRVEMVRTLEAANKLPSQQTTEITLEGAEKYKTTLDELLGELEIVFPEEKTTTVDAAVDKPSLERAKGLIVDILPDGTTVIVDAQADENALKTVKSKLDEVPTEKLVEIKLQGEIDTEIARIRAQAETIQNTVEWSAKLDIAEVEANAEIVTTLAEGWASAFESTAALISDALSALTSTDDPSKEWAIESVIRAEQERRDKILENETKLTDAQVAFMEARIKAMEKGEGLISIKAEGLVPELTLVLHKIIELTQIRANEEGLEFLLGVP